MMRPFDFGDRVALRRRRNLELVWRRVTISLPESAHLPNDGPSFEPHKMRLNFAVAQAVPDQKLNSVSYAALAGKKRLWPLTGIPVGMP
jgi:hypothetical protein